MSDGPTDCAKLFGCERFLTKHSGAFTPDDIGDLYNEVRGIVRKLPDGEKQLVLKALDVMLTLSIQRNRVREAVR